MNYKTKECKAVISWKKQPGDKVVSTLTAHLKTRYFQGERQRRPKIREYFTSRGFYKTGDEYDGVIDFLLGT